MALAVCVAACGQAKFTDADQCLLVDLKTDHATTLSAALDRFARANGLEADNTLPIASLYTLRTGGRKIAIVTYSIEVMESVSELALFRFDDSGSDELAGAFEAFIAREVKPTYGLNRCADVPGYAAPKASK